MDPQIEMVLRMLSDVRQLVVDENIETRKQYRDGVNAMLTEQKFTNGRVNKLEQDVARLDTLVDERTSNMVCAEHAATFKHIEEKMAALDSIPARVEVLEQANPAELRETKGRSAAWTTGAVAAVIAMLGGIWEWLSKR